MPYLRQVCDIVLLSLQQAFTRTGNGLERGSSKIQDSSNCERQFSRSMLVVSAIISSMRGGWSLLFAISFSTGIWKAPTQAIRNQVQNKGRERLLHVTGLGKSFPQDTVMLKIYVNSRGDWSSTQRKHPLRTLTYIEPCLTQIIF